jgi:hypothetical protein
MNSLIDLIRSLELADHHAHMARNGGIRLRLVRLLVTTTTRLAQPLQLSAR